MWSILLPFKNVLTHKNGQIYKILKNQLLCKHSNKFQGSFGINLIYVCPNWINWRYILAECS